jgi:putative ribosome biogenesis GTPase RsgA
VARPLAQAGLLERGTEHGALVRALNALPNGRGNVVAIVGPAGIGKTAVLNMSRSDPDLATLQASTPSGHQATVEIATDSAGPDTPCLYMVHGWYTS